MKPKPQISHKRHAGFPLTDYNYQTTADPKSSGADFSAATKSPAFHKLSSEFFDVEESRHYWAEFSTFTALGLITAWPIFSSIVAMAHMAHH
jgi:hypothetical protein